MKSEIADLVSTRLATPDPSAPATGNSTSAVDTFSIYRPIAVDDDSESPRPSLTKPCVLPVSHPGDGRRAGISLDLRGFFAAVDLAEGTALDWLIDGAAWTVFLAGAAVRLGATLWIAGRKKQTVVDDQAVSRVPQSASYVGSFVMGIGLGLFLNSLAFGAGLGLVMSLYLWFVVPAEERYMRSASARPSTTIAGGSLAGFRTFGLLRRNEIFQRAADQGHSFPRSADEWPAGCAGGHGRTDVPPPRDGLADLVVLSALRDLLTRDKSIVSS